jgi:hypothetical protein
LVAAFRSAVAKCNINGIPKIVAELLDTEAWRIFLVSMQLHRNTDFLAFITDPPHMGCGWDPGMVEALLQKSGDQITLMRWRQAVTAPQGAHHDNVMMKVSQGNSLAYTLDRLSRERPDLLAKVESKRMSANAAAIQAGFRKKPTPFERVQRNQGGTAPCPEQARAPGSLLPSIKGLLALSRCSMSRRGTSRNITAP